MGESSGESVEVSSPWPWFSIRTRARAEKVTTTVLRSKGFEEYLPLYRSRRRWSDRIVEKELPLFPGYIFCRFDPTKRMPILTTPGVVSIIGFGGLLTPVAEEEIEAIRTVLRSGLTAEPWPYLREGQRVRIVRGALEGLDGLLISVKNEWRLVVSLTLLQRSVAVEVDRDWVCPE